MFVLYCRTSLLHACVISMVLSQSANDTPLASPALTSSLKIGPAACYIFGDYDKTFDCELEAVQCHQLPDECSSYVLKPASVSLDNDVHPTAYPIDTGYFQNLSKCAKIPVIMGYGYNKFQEWSIALACCGADGMNVKNEVEGLKAYLSKFGKISGLMLRNLDIIPESPSYKDFSNNLKCYIKSLRTNLPGMEIGIFLYADQFQMFYDNPTQEWINFKDLDSVIDFYVFNCDFFIQLGCTRELKNIGITPLAGNKYSMAEKTLDYINKAGIPKEKLSLRIDLGPFPKGDAIDYSLCEINSLMMCKDPKKSAEWCAPTTQLLYDQGVFTKKNAMGFGAAYVDLDDLHCDCQCSRSFPLFRALLDGFNGAPRPASCALLDRP